MSLKRKHQKIFNDNIIGCKHIFSEIKNYVEDNRFDDFQIKVIGSMEKQIYDLYTALIVHYNEVFEDDKLNITSFNVVLRSFFESCLNIAYLFQADDIKFEKKLDIYYVSTLLSIKSKIEEYEVTDEAIELKIKNYEEELNQDRFKEIIEKGIIKKAENGKPEKIQFYWWKYYSNYNSLKEFSYGVGYGEIFKLYYGYLSLDVHGKKELGNLYRKDLPEEYDHLVYITNYLMYSVLINLNSFIKSIDKSEYNIEGIGKKLNEIQNDVFH